MPGGSSGRPGSRRTGSGSRAGSTTSSTRSRRPGKSAAAGRCTCSGVDRCTKPDRRPATAGAPRRRPAPPATRPARRGGRQTSAATLRSCPRERRRAARTHRLGVDRRRRPLGGPGGPEDPRYDPELLARGATGATSSTGTATGPSRRSSRDLDRRRHGFSVAIENFGARPEHRHGGAHRQRLPGRGGAHRGPPPVEPARARWSPTGTSTCATTPDVGALLAFAAARGAPGRGGGQPSRCGADRDRGPAPALRRCCSGRRARRPRRRGPGPT